MDDEDSSIVQNPPRAYGRHVGDHGSRPGAYGARGAEARVRAHSGSRGRTIMPVSISIAAIKLARTSSPTGEV